MHSARLRRTRLHRPEAVGSAPRTSSTPPLRHQTWPARCRWTTDLGHDSVAYLRNLTTYKKILVFIYDASSSVQEHDVTAAALLALEDVIDVVIVFRLCQLPPSGTDRAGAAAPVLTRSRAKKVA